MRREKGDVGNDNDGGVEGEAQRHMVKIILEGRYGTPCLKLHGSVATL